LPSALCRVVPYLFLHGQSGSGKSTIAKIASYLHGISINSSSDTFAGIRNSLNDRRNSAIEIASDDPKYPSVYRVVERNTCMVWDDIDSSVFSNSPDLYRLFKFGYDRSTDKITLSSKEVGENLEFRCFCPKVFSSISPLHLNDRFKELKRRLIVIPCKRIEE
jgi:energy-coupling factor transporter ATP-binding protein EcfA2